jgi:2-polyprenyl-6-methoxyphenol hydroxylase-like FAD-dependent oxidoreductase
MCRYGSAGFVLPKPVLYNILLSHVPSAKIIRGTKILSVSSGDSFVTVLQDNGDTAVCDIVVGADGTYSAVRQSIFDQMRKHDVMDPKDKEPMKYSTVCLIGQTRPLSDVEFPIMAKDDCQFIRVLGRNKPYSV